MTNLVDIKIPQPENAIFSGNTSLRELADRYVVCDNNTANLAVMDIQRMQEKWNAIEAMRKTLKGPIDEAAKTIQSFFVPHLNVLVDAKKILRDKVDVFVAKEKEAARQEEVRLKLEAAKRAEELAKQSAILHQLNDVEGARALKEYSDMQMAAVSLSVPQPVKIDGHISRTTWVAVVEDKMALVKAIAMGIVPISAIDVNQQWLNGQARALHSEMQYPGVRAVEQSSGAIRKN
jgi:hypothetical protein